MGSRYVAQTISPNVASNIRVKALASFLLSQENGKMCSSGFAAFVQQRGSVIVSLPRTKAGKKNVEAEFRNICVAFSEGVGRRMT